MIRHLPFKVFSIFFVSLLLGLWLMQNGIESYWQQKYHQASPLTFLQDYAIWRSGGRIQAAITGNKSPENETAGNEVARNETIGNETTENQTARDETAENKIVGDESARNETTETEIVRNEITEDETAGEEIARNETIENEIVGDEITEDETAGNEIVRNETAGNETTENISDILKPAIADKSISKKLTLNQNDQVLLAGDSLMQALAPHIQRALQKQKIKTINMGKPSTGLRYPGYFDWPKTIHDQLEENEDIKMMIMLLGANDPWDLNDPNNKNRVYRFKTPGWENFYRSEIRKIITSAELHEVQLIWIGLPYMRGNKYNQKIMFIDRLIDEEVKNAGYTYFNTKEMFSNGKGDYASHIQQGGKKVLVRNKDGIHINNTGSKILSKKIVEQIEILP